MNIIVEPPRSEWRTLVARPVPDGEEIEAGVKDILSAVRERGDEALLGLENRFDQACFKDVSDLRVSEAEIEEAFRNVPEELKAAIDSARGNIRRFHEAQIPSEVRVETSPGVVCVSRPVPLRRVGLYVPGGRAPLFSTVLMLAVPAEVAGCPDVLLCTPPGRDGKVSPAIIYAAVSSGVREIFKVGGAQAVAAMAYGTGTISRRDKIFGPGNRFVTKAKQLVSLSDVAIDMPAGPSEVMVLADSTANPAFVASDLLSQCEHGPDSQAVLVCSGVALAEAVRSEVLSQAERLSRGPIIEASLRSSRIIVLPNRNDMAAFADGYAPEHLIISVAEPWEMAGRISAAGSIFIGNYSPESAGDYASGTNHTLPTGGWARSLSGLGVESFMRRMSIQELSREGLEGIGPTIRTMALAEGLDAHAAAVEVRVSGFRGLPSDKM